MIAITVTLSCSLVISLWQEGEDQIWTGFLTAELTDLFYLFIFSYPFHLGSPGCARGGE